MNNTGDSENSVLRIAGDNDHPPYEYVDENGNYKGFNVDIMRAVGIELGIEIEFAPMEWKEAINALEEGEVDAIQGMSKTNDRKKLFSFASPTVTNSQAMFVLKGTNYITELTDLSDVRVSFQEGDINEEMIHSIPGIIAIPKKNQKEAIHSLLNGESEVFIGNRLTGLYYLQKEKKTDLIKIAGEPIGVVEYGPATKKGNGRVRDKLSLGIETIKKNGTYQKIYKKWFGENLLSRGYILQVFIKEIVSGALIIVLVILFFVFWNKKLKSEVSKRTSELENANRNLIIHQEKIHNLAYYDTVTGLPNRIYFTEALNEAIDAPRKDDKKHAILNLDIDRFKHINDTLGHDIGDKILMMAGKRIAEILDKTDVLARVGGDEFFVMVKDISNDADVIKVAEAIIRQFKKPFTITDYELFITTSIGISIYPEGGEDFQELMKTSDLAMYKAKDTGGNSYFIYNEALSERELENLILINKLRQAEENNEFIVYYQPKVEASTGNIAGMEALLRWKHRKDGLILPSKFIPIAEETGLIVSIGDWVLLNACRQTKAWIDKGYGPMCVSVNISARQFKNYSLVDTVSRVLIETGLDPQYLELEITESIAIIDIKYTINVLKRLKEIGVHISIDDFGTGYSSLNYLKEMSVDELKIDRTFIKDINLNPKNMAISKTIILLAHQLGLQVTAEGVETEEELKFLKENNCDKIQGYYYSPPVPNVQFEEFLRRNQLH